jgi:hypothetical protein
MRGKLSGIRLKEGAAFPIAHNIAYSYGINNRALSNSEESRDLSKEDTCLA